MRYSFGIQLNTIYPTAAHNSRVLYGHNAQLAALSSLYTTKPLTLLTSNSDCVAAMAPQVLDASVFRPSVAAADETAFLSPNYRSSCSQSRAKKRSFWRRVCSPALYLIRKARELQIWYIGGDAAGAAPEHGDEAVTVEPFFSIPVVAPATSV